MVFIPEQVIKWEHSRIHELRDKYHKKLDSPEELPNFIHNTVLHRSGIQQNLYDITPLSKLHAKVTSKYASARYTHVIDLKPSPPTCSYGCLRLLGLPCTEMCVYAKSLNMQISQLLPRKLTFQGCYDILHYSLPKEHPPCVIDGTSLNVCHMLEG